MALLAHMTASEVVNKEQHTRTPRQILCWTETADVEVFGHEVEISVQATDMWLCLMILLEQGGELEDEDRCKSVLAAAS
jgi:hypothetical protein